MIDKLQCQTHTRTPWGQNPHRYDYRLRYFVMGLLCTSVLAVFIISLVFVGNQAMRNFQLIPPDDSPTTSSRPPLPTSNATETSSTNATTKAPLFYKSGRVT
ncbi:hypothetical protein TARUN_2786 [Trichoderma arundinaceum]|uniref:Uncharacterized protein n=1 Tax=Trichoderma arundinaceum TaxID=490622 RepID=A0A395NTP2_TRIAR|nr:hypothetical protein TARUN_2786 [Trichoderma arundinaceum]